MPTHSTIHFSQSTCCSSLYLISFPIYPNELSCIIVEQTPRSCKPLSTIKHWLVILIHLSIYFNYPILFIALGFFFFKKKSGLTSYSYGQTHQIYNLGSRWSFHSTRGCCPALYVFPVLIETPYFFFFALSRRPCLIAPCSGFDHFCIPNLNQYDVATKFPNWASPILIPSLPANPSLCLLRLLYFTPRYSSKVQVMALLHTYLLIALPPTFFWSLLSFNPHLTQILRVILDVRRAISGTLCMYRCMNGCSTSPHHQHSAASFAPILLRNVSIAPCPIVSWD